MTLEDKLGPIYNLQAEMRQAKWPVRLWRHWWNGGQKSAVSVLPPDYPYPDDADPTRRIISRKA